MFSFVNRNGAPSRITLRSVSGPFAVMSLSCAVASRVPSRPAGTDCFAIPSFSVPVMVACAT